MPLKHLRTIPRAGGIALVPIFLGLLLGSTVQAGPIFPRPWVGERTGHDPLGVAVADFDNDGALDMAVDDRAGGDLRIYLGDGNGGFDVLPGFDAGIGATAPLAHDFDSDGNQDLALANYWGFYAPFYEIVVLPGNGDGTFGPPIGYGHGSSYTVAGGDFNGDGVFDLIGGTIVLLGNGDGTFVEHDIEVNGVGWSVGVADLDGDDLDDYVFESCVRLSNGDGTFADLGCFPVGDDPQGVAVGDLSGDQIPDLVVLNLESNDVSVLLGSGDGTFAPEVRYQTGPPVTTHPEPWEVLITDLDRNGLPDLIVSNWWGGWPGFGRPPLSVFHGTGGGQFSTAVDFDVGGMGFSHGMKLADLDADGIDDLFRTSMPRDTVHWLYGDGRGGFRDNLHEDVEGTPKQTAVADLDADGRQDLAVATDVVTVLLADGAATFAPAVSFCAVYPVLFCPAGSDPLALATGDLTGDGHLDIAAGVGGEFDVVTILAGDGAGNFSYLSSLAVAADPAALLVGDLNADGDADIVAGTDSAVVSVFLNNGDGTFVARPNITVGRGAKSLSLADFDGNAFPDLAVAVNGDDDVTVHTGNGDGTFVRTFTHLVAASNPTGVASGEFTGDGIEDLMLAGEGSGIELFPGNGDGTFGTPTEYEVPGNPHSLLVADLDGDGQDDAAVRAGTRDLVPVFGNGDGTLTVGQRYVSLTGTGLATGDLNLDGRLDVLGHSDSNVVIMLNQLGPSMLTVLADKQTLAWPAAVGALSYDIYRGDLSALADGDDDGLPDSGYGVCLTELDGETRDTFFVDATVPQPSGTGLFYLQSVIDAQGDRGLGSTSTGLPRSPQVDCP